MKKRLTQEGFRARLVKLLVDAHASGLCGLCCARLLKEAVESLIELTPAVTAANLAEHDLDAHATALPPAPDRLH